MRTREDLRRWVKRYTPPSERTSEVRPFAAEYETRGGQRFKTVVEAASLEAARTQFHRDNPHVELLDLY